MITQEQTSNPIQVLPSRLAMGRWCHRSNQKSEEGDIYAAYSADTIAKNGKIRKPFRLNGWLFTTGSISGKAGELKATAYRLICPSHFDGVPKSYREICQSPRGDKGFYHGLLVTHGGNEFVLIGSPVEIVQSDQTEAFQPSLF